MTPLLAPQILLTLTLLASGAAKIGDPRATEDAMRSLRLPARSLHPLAARLLAPLEIVLALAWWIPVAPLQIVVAALVLALMAAYLVIIGRALRFPDPVTCSCFGTLGSPTVSRTTLVRNVVLVALGVGALAVAATGTAARTVTEHPVAVLGWILATAVAALLTVLALGGLAPRESAARPAATASGVRVAEAGEVRGDDDPGDYEPGDDELDYERAVTPFGVIRRADGTIATLRELTAERAVLLLWLNPGCGSCERVLDDLEAWRERLAPFVAIQPLVARRVDSFAPGVLDRAGDDVAEDLESNLGVALGLERVPGAVLLGADGMLAGGPVGGVDDVRAFVEEIVDQVREAAEAGELPAASEA
ncbi:TlpA family protein disulfide reductase [Brachybacterium huguangmaarense]